MTTQARRCFVVAAAWFGAACAVETAAAHHNSAPLYDFSKSVRLEGTVVEFQFVNPHARIRLTVAGANGSAEEWLAEGANAVALRHNGWTGTEIKAGDRVVVTGAPSRDGSRRLEWREILANGQTLGGGNNFPKEAGEILERLEQQRREARGR
jgi:hypothetical protein